MGQSIEEVLNRLVAVEDAAQQMQDAVDAQKKELAAQMEEKKKQFDSMLELKTEQKTEELEANMEHEKAAALEKLREESPDLSLHDIFADWEYGYGVGSEIWPCFDEFLDCEYKERTACGHDEQ